MLNPPSHCHTVEDYLRFDRRAEGRYEYREGDILAMLPGTERHVLIVTNVVGDLRLQLKGRPCKAYSTDMRLKVSSTGLYTYPDVMVACGDAE